MAADTTQDEGAERGPHMPVGVAGRPVLAVLAGWTVFVAACLGGLLWYFDAAVPPGSFEQAVHDQPEPRLQTDPPGDLQAYLAAQQAERQRWAWVRQDAGLVQVPIERAMRLVLARGQAGYAALPDDGTGAEPRDTAADAAAKARTP